MKYILFLITSLFLTTSLFAQNTQLRNTLIFPIEVFGKNGATESIFVNINDAASMSSIAGLRVKFHGLTYTNKASIKINNSAWKDLNNSNVVFLHLNEYASQGMGTTYWNSTPSTLNILIPFPAATFSTTNTVTFRFNDLNGLTVGYRILDIGVIKSNSTELVLHTKKVQDDPSKWKPYSTDPARINNGSNKWFNATITHNGVPIQAKCEDCHVHEGYDLKYFNYSNKSIVLRSTALHSFSLQDAQDIASFIRTRNVTYEPTARPWNPPYQPGPGLDAKPVRSWAAGAGYEWIMTNHWDTLTNIFPTGIASGLVNYGTNGLKPFDVSTYSLNQREIPVPIPFPDWNRWLPHIHPKDAFPTNTAQNANIQNTYIQWYNILNSPTLVKNVNGSTLIGEACLRLSEAIWHYGNATVAEPSSYTPYEESKAALDFNFKRVQVLKWQDVKMFEYAKLFDLEDVGNVVGNGTFDNVWPDKRRWFTSRIFYTGPHVTGTRLSTKQLYPLGMVPYGQWTVESASWYLLGGTLCNGNRNLLDQAQLDQGYYPAFNEKAFFVDPTYNWVPQNYSALGSWFITFVKLLEGTDRGFPTTSQAGYLIIKPWTTLHDIYSLRVGDIPSQYPTSADRQKYSQLCNVATQQICDKMARYSRDYFLSRNQLYGGPPFQNTGERTYYWFIDGHERNLFAINGSHNGDIVISPTTFSKIRALKKKLYPEMP